VAWLGGSEQVSASTFATVAVGPGVLRGGPVFVRTRPSTHGMRMARLPASNRMRTSRSRADYLSDAQPIGRQQDHPDTLDMLLKANPVSDNRDSQAQSQATASTHTS